MKNMSRVTEFVQAPPPGRYLSTVVAAEATISKKSGATMLHLTVRIDDERYSGEEAEDYIITDGTAKGASIGKRKLRGLATPLITRALDTDEDIPDTAIAQELIGQQLFVDYGNEQKMGRSNPDDPGSAYDRPMTITDPKTGRDVPLNKLTVQGYSRHGNGNGNGTAVAAPAQQQVAAPVQQFAPQAPAPAQFVPQQFVQPGQALQQPQFAPQPPAQQFAPQQFAPQAAPQFPGAQYPAQQQAMFPMGGAVAQPVWNNGGHGVEAPVADEGKKRRRS